MDIDGDGKPDFVQFDGEEGAEDPAIGVSRWHVYKNTGAGFATTPTSWSIPYPADYLANSSHSVLDIDSDGKVDFVQVDSEENASGTEIGSAAWHVYRNTGNGFEATHVRWQIPYPCLLYTSDAADE